MALDHVAELSQQAATDTGVLSALRDDPATIRTRLNLSDAHLRALISAGSFTSARPAATTSQAEQSLASNVAAMEVATLFPPEGQGQFPTPGELPPVVPASSTAPARVPAAAPRPTPSGEPSSTPPQPRSASPQASGAPQGITPRSIPGFAPSLLGGPGSTPGRTSSPGQTTGTPGLASSGTGTGTPGITATTGPAGVTSNSQSAGGGEAGFMQQGPSAAWTPIKAAVQAPAVGSDCDCCGSCEVAITSIVGEVTTTAQTAMTAITVIAGLY